jgi:hypothetical protein
VIDIAGPPSFVPMRFEAHAERTARRPMPRRAASSSAAWVVFNQTFNGPACATRELQATRVAGNPAAARFAHDDLHVTLRHPEAPLRPGRWDLVVHNGAPLP